MTVLKMKAGKTFQHLYKAYQSTKYRIIVLKGGSRSGKTYAILQLLITIALTSKQKQRITAWRARRTWAKSTIFKDFNAYLTQIGLFNPKALNHTDLSFTLGKCAIEFGGLDDAQKLHGLTSDIAWINEGIEASKNDFDQLEMRTNQFMIIDCNPSEEEHWIYELDKRPDVLILHSTYKDNPFIEPAVRRKIAGYEPTPENIRQGTADPYKWQVYGLGKIAKKEGLIFPHFEIIKEFPPEANVLGYGLDFGFYPDPTAFGRVGMLNGKLVLDELFYENGLNNVIIPGQEDTPSIQANLVKLSIKRSDSIIADSAAKSNINELRTAGYNIEGVKKYAGSVKDGLELMKNYTPFYVTETSLNAINELKNYTYKKDFATGSFTSEPIDNFNHLIDLFRYVVQTKINIPKHTGIKKITYKPRHLC